MPPSRQSTWTRARRRAGRMDTWRTRQRRIRPSRGIGDPWLRIDRFQRHVSAPRLRCAWRHHASQSVGGPSGPWSQWCIGTPRGHRHSALSHGVGLDARLTAALLTDDRRSERLTRRAPVVRTAQARGGGGGVRARGGTARPVRRAGQAAGAASARSWGSPSSRAELPAGAQRRAPLLCVRGSCAAL